MIKKDSSKVTGIVNVVVRDDADEPERIGLSTPCARVRSGAVPAPLERLGCTGLLVSVVGWIELISGAHVLVGGGENFVAEAKLRSFLPHLFLF